MKDVCVEEIRGCCANGVRHPRESPHTEVRIGVIWHSCRELADLRIGEETGERRKGDGDSEVRSNGADYFRIRFK
jgi:hypothetical protein